MNAEHREDAMMTPELRSLSLFRGCTSGELRKIARLSTEIDVPIRRVLCVEGAIGAEFFVIMRGTAHVKRRGRQIACLGPGQAFGEVALLSRDALSCRTASVVAAEPMTVLVFSRAEFNSLIDGVPVVARRLLESVSKVALGFAAENAPARGKSARTVSGGEYGEVSPDLVVFAH
jgi:CRP-like cAMP-binding protein